MTAHTHFRKRLKKIYFRNGEEVRGRDQLNPLEKLIRSAVGDGGMYDGTLVQIKYTNGFEQWDSYEGWGQGWVVELYNTQNKVLIGKGYGHYLDYAIQKAVESVPLQTVVDNTLGEDYQ